eukprot:TRINITY_DN4556_c0_g1_i25.p2 TRINITY_DN4556_c0_g1~~TRINITY_DN4556_c0_g1_i25.p2  ORF type:complete len:269 (-),score=63.06 TRINITY_DN4556_c0_g1_i25:502-1308(-)
MNQILENNHRVILNDYKDFLSFFTIERMKQIQEETKARVSVRIFGTKFLLQAKVLSRQPRLGTFGTRTPTVACSLKPKALPKEKDFVKMKFGTKKPQDVVTTLLNEIHLVGTKDAVLRAEERVRAFFSGFSKDKIEGIPLRTFNALVKSRKEIQTKTNTQLKLLRAWESNGLEIIGLTDDVIKARKLIELLLSQNIHKSINLRNSIGAMVVVGPNGLTLQGLRADVGCQISIDINNQLHMVGTQQQLDLITKRVLELLRKSQYRIGWK